MYKVELSSYERKDEMAETRFCGGHISLVVERAECLSCNYFHGVIRYTSLLDDMPDFTDASNLDGTTRKIEVSPGSGA